MIELLVRAARIVALGLLLVWGGMGIGLAQSGGNEPRPMGDVRDRLAAPPLSDPPTPLELGRYDYYLSCMVCHGDRGQGLTEEWRNAGDPADANCWQSRCHASNHPPEGFELPRYAPPVIGQYALARFATIGDLYDYLGRSMPWHLPGLLEEEQYRQIALFLADANGLSGLSGQRRWAEMAAQPLRVSGAALSTESESGARRAESGLALSAPLAWGGAVLALVVVVWVLRRRR